MSNKLKLSIGNENVELSNVEILEIFKNALDRESSSSNQIPGDIFETDYDGSNIIRPPEDPSVWSALSNVSTRLTRSINIIATNTVGLGYEIHHKYPEEDALNLELNELYKQEELNLKEFLDNPNPEQSFNEILTNVKIDEEFTGNGYLEVVRGRSGKKEIYHIPSHTVRVLKPRSGERDISGYIQIRGGSKVYFKKFGDTRLVDYKTGKIESKLSLPSRATEIIHFKVYSPKSSYYGVPRYESTSPAITGRRFSSIRDMSFFENDAVPRIIFTVTGGARVDTESIDRLTKFLTTTKGVKNASRALVIQAEEKKSIINRENKSTIGVHPLTVGVQEDASFLKYKEACDEEIREAFGLSKVFYGISEDINRASAVISRTSTVNQILLPELRRYEYRLNNTIFKEFNLTRAVFRFLQPKVTDIAQDADIMRQFGLSGGITPNDVRKFLNLDTYKEEWGNIPIQIIVALIQNGYLGYIEDSDGKIKLTRVDTYKTSGKASSSGNGSEDLMGTSTYIDGVDSDGEETTEAN